MVTTEEKKELFSKLGELRKEVILLRTDLNQIDDQKEAAFQKKDKYNLQIKDLIRNIKFLIKIMFNVYLIIIKFFYSIIFYI